MWSSAPRIAPGDTLILWLTREQIQTVVVTPGKVLNIRFGYYRHQDFVGLPYGSKLGSRNGKGFLHLLRPTPELWTLALPHRTQILYLADIALVTAALAIRAGSKVVEAGTGSGSFSHSTARTIGSAGHLYTFEFHQARASTAQEEFKRHGLTNVTLAHRNVCKDGFDLHDVADAVFLDLPAPWDAVEHARKALRKDRLARICCFSPCMEQVLRTVSALNEAGFTDVTMYETLLRPHDVQPFSRPLPISEVAARLRQAEIRREERRQRQIADARAKVAARTAAAAASASASEIEVDAGTGTGAGADATETRPARTGDAEDTPHGEKRKRDLGSDAAADKRPRTEAAQAVQVKSEDGQKQMVSTSQAAQAAQAKGEDGQKQMASKPFADVRGHTSYLTFACLVPQPARTPAVVAEESSTTLALTDTHMQDDV